MPYSTQQQHPKPPARRLPHRTAQCGGGPTAACGSGSRSPHSRQSVALQSKSRQLEPRHCQPGGSGVPGTWRQQGHDMGGQVGGVMQGAQPRSWRAATRRCEVAAGQIGSAASSSKQPTAGKVIVAPRPQGAGCTHAGAAPHIFNRHQPAAGALAHQLDSSLHALAQVRHLQGRAAGPTASAATRSGGDGGGDGGGATVAGRPRRSPSRRAQDPACSLRGAAPWPRSARLASRDAANF